MNIYYLKTFLQKIYPKFFYRILKNKQRNLQILKNREYSDEEPLINKFLEKLEIKNENKFAVDIASQDGVLGSQTILLYKNGWKGLAFEFDGYYFSVLAKYYIKLNDVQLIKSKISPDNILSFLKAAKCPINFGFLSLDIDSFDYYILDKILKKYRPSLICLEINENIPPPIKFTVEYDEFYNWDGLSSHFQGQSISKANELCLKYNYKIIELHYNNLFIVPFETENFYSLSPEDAYDKGYKSKKDRMDKFPWNKDMEMIFEMKNEEIISYLNEKYKEYEGKYSIKI